MIITNRIAGIDGNDENNDEGKMHSTEKYISQKTIIEIKVIDEDAATRVLDFGKLKVINQSYSSNLFHLRQRFDFDFAFCQMRSAFAAALAVSSKTNDQCTSRTIYTCIRFVYIKTTLRCRSRCDARTRVAHAVEGRHRTTPSNHLVSHLVIVLIVVFNFGFLFQVAIGKRQCVNL